MTWVKISVIARWPLWCTALKHKLTKQKVTIKLNPSLIDFKLFSINFNNDYTENGVTIQTHDTSENPMKYRWLLWGSAQWLSQLGVQL